MKHGIALLTQIPLRSEPSEKSEQVSQILFGETFRIEDIRGSWANVYLHDDGYTGWIDLKMIAPVSAEGYARICNSPMVYTNDIFHTYLHPKGPLILPPGSKIPFEVKKNEVFFEDFKLNVANLPFFQEAGIQELIKSAEKWLNCPYLWGGKTPFGFDCSGFVQVVYKTIGIRIPRDAFQQATTGTAVDFISAAQPGDLAFFDNEEGKITHVGFIHSDGNIIHCSGNVKIDKIDQQGIYDNVIKKYTHKLRLIRRILD